MKVNLPEGWEIIRTAPQNWPEVAKRKKLGYAHGPSKKIYLRDEGWTTWPVVSALIEGHEKPHAVQYEVKGDMWHTKAPKYSGRWYERAWLFIKNLDQYSGIMSERGTLEWALSPLVSLIRGSWLDAESRELLKEYADA